MKETSVKRSKVKPKREQILTMDSWEREALWKASHEESLKYDWDKTAAEYYGVLRSLF